MTDIMIDLETTGVNPDRNGILQISAVKFNLEARTVEPQVFNRCLMLPRWRSWDQGTAQWWKKQPEVLKSIIARGEEPKEVLKDLHDWVQPGGSLRFWSKPSHFDFMFLSSYFHDFNMKMPFCFRAATDMNSFLRGRYFPNSVPEIEVKVDGPAHDAINDCYWQLKLLFEHTKGESDAS